MSEPQREARVKPVEKNVVVRQSPQRSEPQSIFSDPQLIVDELQSVSCSWQLSLYLPRKPEFWTYAILSSATYCLTLPRAEKAPLILSSLLLVTNLMSVHDNSSPRNMVLTLNRYLPYSKLFHLLVLVGT